MEGEASAALPSLNETELAILHASVERDVPQQRSREAEALIEVALQVQDWASFGDRAARVLTYTLCQAIRPAEDDWDAVPLGDGVMHVATLSEAHLQDLIAASKLGDYEAVANGPVAPTSHSHYADKQSIARAVLCGTAIVAICGAAFVPRRDPEKYPVCPACQDVFERHTGEKAAAD